MLDMLLQLEETYRDLGLPADAALGVHEKVLEKVATLLPSLSGKHVTDAPCGSGAIAETCARRGANVIGVDLRPPLNSKTDGLKYEKSDLNEGLPVETCSQDLVLSVEGIEHLENPSFWLREINRVLKPGGYAVISTPNIDSLSSRFKFFSRGHHRYFEPMGYRPGRPRASGHIHAIDYTFMRWAAEMAGLRVIEIASRKPIDANNVVHRACRRLFYKRFPDSITTLIRGNVAIYVLRKDAPADGDANA
jgi:SAM-dependent methyltransferase